MDYGVVTGIVSGIIVAVLIWFAKVAKDWKDTHTILKFLQKSKRNTPHRFRSNHAIASETNLSEDRVRKLCSKSKKIRRNTEQKESWTLREP